jgi:sterol 3beta-glucosyltransferase
MMKITILTIGSRGDFQPYIALGNGLKQAGFQVRIPAPPAFQDLITGHGLEYVPVNSVNPQEFMRHSSMQTVAQRNNQFMLLLTMFREARGMLRAFLDEAWQFSQDSDAIVSNIVFFGAYDCAERLGIPFILAPLDPLYPTYAFASPAFAPPKFRVGAYNFISHCLFDQVLWQPFRQAVNEWRQSVLDLPPHPFWGPYRAVRQPSTLTILGYSPSVFPAPPDWPSSNHVTGYWFLDKAEDWQPPMELQRFLDAGSPPVYVGFGSMVDRDPEHITSIVVKALEMSEQRGIISNGWSGLGDMSLPSTVTCVGSVPHAWLFKHMSAVVHHGGAGTTAAGLRAGVPTIITPFMGDQPFWGHRVAEIGVGPEPLSYHKLTAEALAQRIVRAVTDSQIRNKAMTLGGEIQKEDGVTTAVQFIRDHLCA